MARVLVIDDEELMRDLIRDLLEEENHAVEEASDGEVGLERHRAHPADLVITDIALPGKDGLTVIAEIRRMSPQTKVIVVSGGGYYAERDLLPEARALGVASTFTKPFHPADILRAVRVLVGN